MASSGGGGRDRRGEDPSKAGKSGNGVTSIEVCNKQDQDGRHKVEDRREERYCKGDFDREKKDLYERRNSREHGQHDCRLVIFSYVISISYIYYPLFLSHEDCALYVV